MNEYVNSPKPQRPSIFSSFFKGAMAGLVSGVVMALVIATITAVPMIGAGTFLATFGGALVHSGGFMVLAASLFGGIMRAGHAFFDAPGRSTSSPEMVPVPVPSMSGPAVAPAMAPVMAYPDTAQDAPTQDAPTKSWVAETRGTDSRNTIEQILANGSLSDKDRASAILASREAADQQASRA